MGRVRAAWDPPLPQHIIDYSDSSCTGDWWVWKRRELWAGLPGKVLVPLGLFPDGCSPRRQILLRNGTPVTMGGEMLLLCSLLAPEPSQLGRPLTVTLGLKEDLNWAEMLQVAEAGRELQARKRSGAGRRRGLAPVAVPFLGVVFFLLRHQLFKMFLF